MTSIETKFTEGCYKQELSSYISSTLQKTCCAEATLNEGQEIRSEKAVESRAQWAGRQRQGPEARAPSLTPGRAARGHRSSRCALARRGRTITSLTPLLSASSEDPAPSWQPAFSHVDHGLKWGRTTSERNRLQGDGMKALCVGTLEAVVSS